jgi:hypothetical protein
MKKSILLLFVFSFLVSSAERMPENYKEAIQRGYMVRGDSVRFPDSTVCHYSDFVNGICGKKWLTKDYCVGEGKQVWDADKCCKGLQPFFVDKESDICTCEKTEKIQNIGGYQSKMIWMAVLFPGLLILIALSMYIMRGRAKRNQNL